MKKEKINEEIHGEQKKKKQRHKDKREKERI